ncbi:GYF_domain [Hexamita inflata]|uniref:GYF domain n=1 Tax=Hexamita inflata TaxID=28002 RepID=A0AA86TIH9_9EUKA|nr:GYF domain [Hexamita inflata]
MSRNNLEKPNENSPQSEDVERFRHNTQINAEKPASLKALNQNVVEIAHKVTAQVSTKADAPRSGNNESRKSKSDPLANNVNHESKDQDQQTQNIQKAYAEPKDNQQEPKENDSEPETQIYYQPEKANKVVENIPENENDWYYLDLNDQIQGPFSTKQMNKWNSKGKLFEKMLIKRGNYSFRLQKEQQYLPFLFKDQKENVKKELVDLTIENKHEDDFKENEKLLAVEVETNAQMKQNVTKKDPQIEMRQQITKNNNIPKEIKDVENPEAESNITGKPKTTKTNLFGDDFYDYDLTYEPVKRNQPQQNHQAHENNNTGNTSNTQASAQSYSTQYDQQQQTQQQVNASEKQQYYEQNNESINYHPFDDSREEEESHESQLKSQQQSAEQFTNSPTDSKWTQSQQKAFEASIFEVIKQYFDIEFQTLQEAILHHRKETISPDGGNATRIHLNFKKIASDNKISEQECNHKFQTLQANTLDQWPDEVVVAVKARVVKLWKEIQEPDIAKRKKLIKAIIEQEFLLKQQVQYNYKEITNKIYYSLNKLQ